MRLVARVVLGLAAVWIESAQATDPAPDEDPAAAERGALIAAVARCGSCHTAPDGEAFAGGHAIETRYGTFYGSNLTADPEHGIGAWSLDAFVRAMRRGTSPNGRPYYPAFPYGSFTGMTDADLADLFAYLGTVPAVAQADAPHELRFPYGWRFLLRGWKLLELDRGPLHPDPAQSDDWNRGRYLGDAVAHCGECHTPRNGIGGLKQRRALAGSDEPPEPSPNITPGAIGGWSVEDWVTFLELGMTPDGDFSGGEMRRVIRDGTAKLSEEDRRALAVWLRSVPAHVAEAAVGDEPDG